jgi:foldase protein PrsA
MKKVQKAIKKFLADKNIVLPKVSAKKMAIGTGIVAILLFLFVFKSLFVAAVVNNTIITRFSLDRELEKQAGKQLLDSKVTQALVMQEGAKQNIKVTAEDISARVSEIEKQIPEGQKLDDLLAAYSLTRQEFEKQLSYEIIVTKLLEKDITITDEEIKTYFDANKTTFPAGSTADSVKSDITGQLKQTKLSEKYQTLVQELKSKAKIFYFLNL